MKNIFLALYILVALNANGQETQQPFDGHKWQAPYNLSIPANWGVERFLIPISFAPKIPYKGVEDIRFTPGWAKRESNEYWTYAFLWYLDGNIKIDAKIIAQNLTNYYTGLVEVNTDSATAARSKAIPVIAKFERRDAGSYTGSIQMTDYMTRETITLNCIVHLRYCADEKKTFIFHELSPRPLDDPTWQALHRLWQDLKCR